jgi:hypothetical protein
MRSRTSGKSASVGSAPRACSASTRQKAAVAVIPSAITRRAVATAAASPRSFPKTKTAAAASRRASSSREVSGSRAIASSKARDASAQAWRRAARMPTANSKAGVGGVAARTAEASVTSTPASSPASSWICASSSQ